MKEKCQKDTKNRKGNEEGSQEVDGIQINERNERIIKTGEMWKRRRKKSEGKKK